MLRAATLTCLLIWAGPSFAQPADAGHRQYDSLCSRCHGADGHGGELGPAIVSRLAPRTDEEIAALIRAGVPRAGMPAFRIANTEMRALVTFLRTLRPPRESAPVRITIETTDGQILEGLALNQTSFDLQLRSDDGRIHLFRRVGERYRRVTSDADWPTYNGQLGGNRYSTLDQIDKGNVSRLAPRWVFTLPGASRLEVTPVVVDGVMYVTSANECYALDAGNGRRIWHYERPKTRGVVGDAAGGINRGVAVAGDRLFMITDHAHIFALNRFTGVLLWETEMADWRQNYGATSAPLAVGDLVISGTSGGDEGVRGFLAAFDQATGKEAWRFWTVPRRGEPGSETWKGKDIDHPCAAAWLTGTYDPALETVYWPTGNPCPDHDGSERVGDNLYSDSVLALDRRTGALKWFFQYTPHDLWDWDAQQPPVLVDADWQGQPRKLLLHANRNGFFYVLDRTNGSLLLAKPFVRKLTWALEIGPGGRPVLNPDQTPTPEGTKVCPALEGATNWFSTSFSPATGLYYVQTLEKCSVYTRTPETWKAGRSYYGGATRQVPDEPGQKVLRALDVRTGQAAWELPQNGPANSWGGTLATAGGLVFFGEDSGALMAADASSGQPLWHFQANQLWKASPMTYSFDGRQYVAVASGPNVIAFALVESDSDPGGQNWTHRVRIAGYGLGRKPPAAILRDATDSHVFGIEVDNDITGRYESFLDPDAKLAAIRDLAKQAHGAGNRAFVYIAGTECITKDADNNPHTLAKDHPDWLQRKLSGEPASFTSGAAFWIARGDEDVWISPYATAWREQYMKRVRQIAATGIDGIYVDIPYWMTHFDGWEDSWASFDDYTVEAFRRKTGLDARRDLKLGDFADPHFRQWIDFRIETITEFMGEIDRNAKEVNPTIMTIPEIYPGIERAAVVVGADVYQLYGVTDAIAHEYEFGGGNHMATSRTPLDWFRYQVGMRSFRAFAQGKATWILNYSWDGDPRIAPPEPMMNLAMSVVMAGANFWDAATHVMSGSNDLPTRQRIFDWIDTHEKTLYEPRTPIHPIGVYFSPATRNYFPDLFLRSYQGMVILLLQKHLELQIVTPRTLAAFRGSTLILPDVRVLGEAERTALNARMSKGLRLIVTGTDTTGLPASDAVRRFPECPGSAYLAALEKDFLKTAPALAADFIKALAPDQRVRVDASSSVATEIARVDGKLHIFIANFDGLVAGQNAVQTPQKGIRVSLPAAGIGRAWFLPFLGEAVELHGQRQDGNLVFVLPEVQKGAVVWFGGDKAID